MGTIRIHIDPSKLTKEDFDHVLMSKYDIFYRRIVEYVLNDIEKKEPQELLAIIVDDNGVEYEMNLPPEGYIKSLNKAMFYFKMIEEYETCSLIRDIIKQIDK